MELLPGANERLSLILKNGLALVLLLGDVIMNAIFDVIDHEHNPTALYVLFGLQIFLRLALFFVIIILMWDTFIFKYGLFGRVCERFRAVFLLGFLSFLFFLASRGLRLRAITDKKTLYALWDGTNYYGIYVIHITRTSEGVRREKRETGWAYHCPHSPLPLTLPPSPPRARPAVSMLYYFSYLYSLFLLGNPNMYRPGFQDPKSS